MAAFIIGALILVILLIIVWYISTMNTFKVMRVKVDEAESGSDVALAKRSDGLTKMLDTCKGYMKHEAEVFADVIKLRKGMTLSEKVKLSEDMDALQKQINITAEAYPDLKSGETFIMLQKSIADVEEHLQAARRAYNGNVSKYNQRLVVFPASIVANACGMTKCEFFEASEKQREDVKIEF